VRLARAQVPLRERAAGAGFQVALEATGCLLVGELELHQQPPWTMRSGVAAGTCIVPFEPTPHAGRDPNVVALRVRHAAEDIDESQGVRSHSTGIARDAPDNDGRKSRIDLSRVSLRYEVSGRPGGLEGCRN